MTIESLERSVLTFLRRYVDAQPVGVVAEWSPAKLDLDKIAKGIRIVQTHASIYLRRGEYREIVLQSPDCSVAWQVRLDVMGPVDAHVDGRRKCLYAATKSVRVLLRRSEYGVDRNKTDVIDTVSDQCLDKKER